MAFFATECVWFHRPDLREDGLEGYGFEAPRVYGGWRVKKSLQERWAKFKVIRNNNDLVTHCPPALFRFCHAGKILKIHGSTDLVKAKWVPKCIKDHYPQTVHDGLVKYENEKEDK